MRWGLLISALILAIHLLGKSVIRFDVNYGDPHPEKSSEFRRRANDPPHEAVQNEILKKFDRLKLPKNDHVVRQEDNIAQQVDEPKLVHAFTGKTNLPPVYLDYVDMNQPWDKELEVSNSVNSLLVIYLFVCFVYLFVHLIV